MFENFKVYETEFAGRPLKIETGKMAQLANGSCLVRYGETCVHVAVTAAAKPRDGVDFSHCLLILRKSFILLAKFLVLIQSVKAVLLIRLFLFQELQIAQSDHFSLRI